MPNFCAAPNCTSNSSKLGLLLFRFPRDAKRCKQWVENCHRKDIEDKTPDQLNRHFRLCAGHFEPSMIHTTSLTRTGLKENAIPTIFDLSSDLNNTQSRQHKRMKESTEDDPKETKERKKNSEDQTETNKDAAQLASDEKAYKEYLKSLFEVLVVLGKQSIPLNGHTEEGQESKFLNPSNFQALLEYRMNAGDEALRKRFESTVMNIECCSSAQQRQMMEVCENCIREELLVEVREGRFFSLVTDSLVKISGECHLPMFLRFVDQANCLREEFIGFLPFEGAEETVTERLLSEVTEKWGLNMEYCRGQAHFSSGVHASKIKAIANKLTEKYPTALHTPGSSRALNFSLANGMALTGVQIVISTFKKIESFFNDSPSLQSELEHAISIFYQGKDEKANELKEACHTNWTARHDAFELAVDVLEALLLCLDSIHDNEDLRWSDQVTHEALEISAALADFEFVMALVVLKSTLSFTRAFGKNLQGQTMDVYFAANSLSAVLHSLKEVFDNIDVYHEFWFEEAINLAAALEIPVKVPRLYMRKHRAEAEIRPEIYFKDHLTVPVVSHVIQELKDLFSESHLKALRCLSLVPAVMGQLKFNTSEEENVDMYRKDLPNADTLPAELHCWRVKWKHRGKEVNLPSSVHETLQLSDVKFFPNVLAFLRVLSNLPVLTLEENNCDAAHKRFKMYLENTPDKHRSKSLAFLNIHYDARHDLDFMVDTYIEMYPDK